MESIGIIGVGKLGLCITLALENAGYNMVCYEKNDGLSSAISNKSLETPEPGVKESLEKARSITMVDSLVPIYRLPVAFIVVATPSLENGAYNHSAVDEVVGELLRLNRADPSYERSATNEVNFYLKKSFLILIIIVICVLLFLNVLL